MKKYAATLTCKADTGQLATKLVIIEARSEYEALGYTVSKFGSCGDIISHAVADTEKTFATLEPAESLVSLPKE